jgi:hypothetical protein
MGMVQICNLSIHAGWRQEGLEVKASPGHMVETMKVTFVLWLWIFCQREVWQCCHIH